MSEKLFSETSNDNTLFITGCCNNHCLMCCQPPHMCDDYDYCYKKNLEIIKNSPSNIKCIGLTGGEPTMAGGYLFKTLKAIREKYPDTLLHFLTNGRLFNEEVLMELKKYNFENIVFAVPLHADFRGDHDTIAGVTGAYSETMQGLYNLAKAHARIELRIIINAINFSRLPNIADFIHYNLPFVEDVVFVGMEAIGFAVKNANVVWIDPYDYREKLADAILCLARWGYEVGVSNIPHCLLPPSIYEFAWQSISDWKVYYPEFCTSCCYRNVCCGVFTTSYWQSPNLRPIMCDGR